MELQLDGRLHEIIRQNSIRNVYEALVEFVTNSVDAYNRVGNIDRRDIWIFVDRKLDNRSDLTIIDQARGMTKDEMISGLFTVGGYTASDTSRGFFGRGCKDCSFLGDVTFTSIRDDKLNQVVIYMNRTVSVIIDDVDVTIEDRNKYIISSNGFHVCLNVDSSMIPKIGTFYNNLKNNVYLRDIYQNSIVVLKEKSANFDERITFSYPDRKLVVSCDYDVPGYDTTAHLEIYCSKEQMPFPKSTDQRQFGINVKSSKSVFENSALYYNSGTAVQDYIFNSNIQYISGVLVCDKIEELARDAVSGNITSSNPFMVIDPNRRGGLFKDHPFTAALYQYAYYMLSIVIERVQDRNEEDLLGNGNAVDFIKSLSDFVKSILPGSSVMYAFRTHEDQSKIDILTNTMNNVELDSDFLGLSWEQLQELSKNRNLKLDSNDVVGSSFDISFSNDPTIKTPYSILYLPGKISMKINANDPSIKPFIEITDSEVNMINTGKGMTAVGNLVTDATTDLMVRKGIMSNTTTSLDINGFNEYQYSYYSNRYNLAPSIYSRVVSSIESSKESKL